MDANGQPVFDGSLNDVMIIVEVLLPQGGVPRMDKVLRKSVDKN